VGRRWDIPWLSLADALAAIAVAGIVLVVGGRLGVRAVDALLDRAPIELVGRIRTAIRGVPGVQGPVDFRARMVGPRVFVDAAVPIDRQTSFEGAHAVVEEIEERIREVVPEASIVIHAEPQRNTDESLADAIRLIATRHAVGAHDIFIFTADGKRCVDLHLEVPGEMSLQAAHDLTERIEADLRGEVSGLGPVYIHVDPLRAVRHTGLRVDGDVGQVTERLRALALTISGIRDCSNISVRQAPGGLWIVCHCSMDGSLTVVEAHELGLELGRRARRQIPGIERVTVHAEPATV
jgi:divalent metal cation (Fe/Co/Zn/Cd) transporter